MRQALCLLLTTQVWGQSLLLDRIAVVVDHSIIKHSDIEADIRVTEFLNNEKLDLAQAQRKKATAKLIDQIFLREEIRLGGYPNATAEDSNNQLVELTKQRFRTDAALKSALQRYGLDENELRDQFRWQLTVLNFINARFRPAVVISDSAVESYYKQHAAELKLTNPRATEDDLIASARDIMTEEEVNRLFFAWLDERHKSAKIVFHEDGVS